MVNKTPHEPEQPGELEDGSVDAPSSDTVPNSQDSQDPNQYGPPDKSKIEIKDSRGVVIGDFARVVINGIDEKVFRRFGLDVRLGFSFLALLTIVSAIVIVYLLLPKQGHMKEDVGCEFCIAVAGFTESKGAQERGIGAEFGATLKRRLEENLAELRQETDMTIDVWGPDKVGSVRGRTIAEVDKSAEQLAHEVGADLLVYGMIETSQSAWQVSPRFYISPDYAFQDALEIIGQDQLGLPFSASGQPIAKRVKKMNDEATPRGRFLASLALGMTHYVTYDYITAQSIFEAAQSDVEHWGDPAAKKLLFLLLGNSVLKLFERQPEHLELLDQSEEYYWRALENRPDYARAYIGLGGAAYMRALLPARYSSNPADTDLYFLEKSSEFYQTANNYSTDPDLAHVREKVSMWLGQNYFADAYAKQFANDQAANFQPAVENFNQVIQAYQENPDETLKVLAAEAHARLGLIHRLENRVEESLTEYNNALNLTDDPARISLYQKAIATLQAP